MNCGVSGGRFARFPPKRECRGAVGLRASTRCSPPSRSRDLRVEARASQTIRSSGDRAPAARFSHTRRSPTRRRRWRHRMLSSPWRISDRRASGVIEAIRDHRPAPLAHSRKSLPGFIVNKKPRHRCVRAADAVRPSGRKIEAHSRPTWLTFRYFPSHYLLPSASLVTISGRCPQ